MISELDIYRSAGVLLRRHRKGAVSEAARRADALGERGDLEGEALWRRIQAAVEELQRRERPPGVAEH